MKTSPTRRDFVKAAAAAPFLVQPALKGGFFVSGSDTLRLGLIGCGGRGTGAALQALRADPGVHLTALGDVFADHLEASLKHLKEKAPEGVRAGPGHRFLGFDAYKKVVDSGVDVVILTTPPHFRPVQLAYAVDAGKHVFAEKPVAVDAPGVRSVMKTVEKSQAQGLGLIVGFCWRYSNGERATFAQLEQGAVGEIRAAYTTYNTGVLWKKPRRPGWSDMEFQLRNWLHFHWLSGDHIVEQAVHSIDKMSWAMGDALPLRATAVGGRQARKGPESGNVWDHFGVTYDYPNGARGFHMCRQIAGCSNDNSDYILGARGICRINGWTPLHEITGENPWKYEGPGNDMYQTEHDEFFASIRAGKPRNDGERVAHSTMLAILGRMAAYTGQTVTWEQALHSTERYGPGSYAWTDLPVEPVPVPGVTKLQLPAEGGK